MRIYFWFIFLFIYTIPFTSAQNLVEDTAVTCVAYWTKGEKVSYNCSSTEEKKSETSHSTLTTKFRLDLRVADSMENAYIIHAVIKNVKPDTQAAADEKAIIRMMEGFTVKYKTDENGIWQEFLNMDEMKKFLLQSFDQAIQKFTGETKEKLKALKPMMGTDEMVNEAVSELLFIHFFHGSQYSRREALYGATEFPNLFGGQPFPAEAKVEVGAVAVDYSTFTITQYTKLDRKLGRPIIVATLRDFFQKMGITDLPTDDELIQKFDIKEILSIQVLAESGWPRKIEDSRTATVNSSYTKKTTTMQLVR